MATSNAINANSAGLIRYDGAGNFDSIIYVAPTAFTPGVTFGGSGAGVTFSTQEGHYMQIGSIVFTRGNITLTNKGAGSGSMLITNMPGQPITNGSTAYKHANHTYTGAWLTTQTNTSSASILPAVSSEIGGNGNQLNYTNFANNSSMVFGGLYFV